MKSTLFAVATTTTLFLAPFAGAKEPDATRATAVPNAVRASEDTPVR